MNVSSASPVSDGSPSDASNTDQPELLERLRRPGASAEKRAIQKKLALMEARLTSLAGQLQSPERMRQIEAARLAVAAASSILEKIRVSEVGSSPGSELLNSLFRSPTS